MFKNDTIKVLEKALDGSSLRHTILSNNIANVNTPGFKKSEASFQDALSQAVEGGSTLALKTTRAKHIDNMQNLDNVSGQVIQITGSSMRTDGNNVDIDVELANLSANNLYYDSIAQSLSSQLALLKLAINEGR